MNSLTWNSKKIENIFCVLNGCPECSSHNGFEYSGTKERLGIDIDIPGDICMPKFSDCKLKPTTIKMPTGKCCDCGAEVCLVPDFITKGTTLTLGAQALVCVRYHFPEAGGWRQVHKQLCDENGGIAHTTLFRAYHSMGANLNEVQEILQNVLKESLSENIEKNDTSGIPRKAVKQNNRKREKTIIQYFLLVWLGNNKELLDIWNKTLGLLEVLIGYDGFKVAFNKRYTGGIYHNSS